MRIFFIHGFCSEVTVPFFKISTKAGSEFDIFRSGKENTEVFRWAIHKHLGFWKMLNPFSYLRLYREEMAKAQDPETLHLLHGALEIQQPEILFCHSMGCELLLNYLSLHALPTSVRRIVFVQADVHCLLTEQIEDRLRERGIVIENYFCMWDQALLSSAIFHKRSRGGLRGLRSKQVRNIFSPLFKPWNLHTAGLRDKRFYKKIFG